MSVGMSWLVQMPARLIWPDSASSVPSTITGPKPKPGAIRHRNAKRFSHGV